MSERKARDLVRARSQGWCEVRITGICLGRATNFHHRKNRSQKSGGWAASNGIDLCGSGTTGCHGYITHNPDEASDWGWTVRSWEDWATKPVLLWTLNYRHAMVLLDDDGCYSLAPFPESTGGNPFDLAVPPRREGGAA